MWTKGGRSDLKDANKNYNLLGKLGSFLKISPAAQIHIYHKGANNSCMPHVGFKYVQIRGAGTVFHLLTSVCIPILAMAAQELITKTSGGKPESEKLAI